MKISIITGVQEEADAFLPGQYERVEQHGHLSVRFVALGAHEVAITCCGVGKVNAALAATLLATLTHAELLMIIGTAGKLSDISGDCFLLHEAVQGDFGAQRPQGFTHYTAGSWPIGPASVEAFRAHPLPDVGLPRARIVTGDCFVECPDRGAEGEQRRDLGQAALLELEQVEPVPQRLPEQQVVDLSLLGEPAEVGAPEPVLPGAVESARRLPVGQRPVAGIARVQAAFVGAEPLDRFPELAYDRLLRPPVDIAPTLAHRPLLGGELRPGKRRPTREHHNGKECAR